MACLRKQPLEKGSFVYYIDFHFKGARYRRSTETDNKKLAQRILDEIRGRIASGKFHLEDFTER